MLFNLCLGLWKQCWHAFTRRFLKFKCLCRDFHYRNVIATQGHGKIWNCSETCISLFGLFLVLLDMKNSSMEGCDTVFGWLGKDDFFITLNRHLSLWLLNFTKDTYADDAKCLNPSFIWEVLSFNYLFLLTVFHSMVNPELFLYLKHSASLCVFFIPKLVLQTHFCCITQFSKALVTPSQFELNNM